MRDPEKLSLKWDVSIRALSSGLNEQWKKKNKKRESEGTEDKKKIGHPNHKD